jgi:phage terminase large subunit-like protein
MRLNIVSPLIARGRVYLPESTINPGCARDWCDAFLSQVCSFPDSKHDDYVDALSQALRVLRDMGFVNIDPVADPDLYYADDDRPKRDNPYAA